MRKSTILTFTIQGLFFILYGYASGLVADDEMMSMAFEEAAEHKWMCDYSRAANDVLYIRCDNLAGLMHDPLITDEAEQSVTKFIPVWRRPTNEDSAVRLVKAVLCDQSGQCEVQMKSLFRKGRLANR